MLGGGSTSWNNITDVNPWLIFLEVATILFNYQIHKLHHKRVFFPKFN